MNIKETPISGLQIIQPDVFADDRGYFFESYSVQKMQDVTVNSFWTPMDGDQQVNYIEHLKFVQDNESFSKKGTLRGLHWQKPPFAQAKLVRVIKGHIIDVAVDLRPNSPTYGQYLAVDLSDANKLQFFIPVGFAHGFVALEDTIFAYKCSNYYNKASEGGLIWNDPDVNIEWPKLDVDYIISEKDQVHPTLRELKAKGDQFAC